MVEQIKSILPISIRNVVDVEMDKNLMEIRLRIGKPVILVFFKEEKYIGKDNTLVDCVKEAYILNKEDMKEFIQYITNYSVYAYEKEISNGFITIEGGHRIGLTGNVIIKDGEIINIKDISCANIRISREVIGCGEEYGKYIYDIDNNNIFNTLIIAPPLGGKTTLLRDLIRIISGDNYYNTLTVGVVDERSEIGASYKGVAQNDIGIRTDILDCCPKEKGMLMLIRSMAPNVIAVDEIGNKKDMEAISQVLNSGIRILCSAHSRNIEELRKKEYWKKMLENRIFERVIEIRSKYITDKNKKMDVKSCLQNKIYDSEGKLIASI